MYETPRCFKCGEEGHIKAHCPNRTPAAKTPVGAPSADGAETTKGHPVPPRRAPEEIADASRWARKIRMADPRFGRPHCADPADLYTSEFRLSAGLHPIHECELRLIAAEQISRQETA